MDFLKIFQKIFLKASIVALVAFHIFVFDRANFSGQQPFGGIAAPRSSFISIGKATKAFALNMNWNCQWRKKPFNAL
ncbi:MAG TPA: hypothetical protein VFW05_00830 [Verrucomicrobiae bacterium]|nr:hypothetical protein [Verrucomicrobiae bacterium]